MSYRRTNDAIRSNSLGNLVNEIATHAHNDYNSDEVPRAIHAWIRGVNDSGPESAPEYEFGSFLEIFNGDSGSGSFQVWSRFQAGIGSTTEADTK